MNIDGPARPVDAFPLPLPASTRVVDVTLRDGLQTVRTVLDTADKLRIVDLLVESGVRTIEAVSFAHPAVLPRLADAEAVMRGVPRGADVAYRGFAPNLRGAQRALDARCDEVVFLLSTSEEGNRGNQGRGTDELLDELATLVRQADGGPRVVVGVAAAFFSTGDGVLPAERLDTLVDRVVGTGVEHLYLADSLGMADPLQVFEATHRVRRRHAGVEVGLHLHVRNGFATANVLAGLLAGADWFESAIGGLGGDLWFPGDPELLGNLPTEDLVALLARLGVATGIARNALPPLTTLVHELTGRRPLDHVSRGGTEESLAALTWDDLMAGFDGVTTTRPRA